MLSSILTGFIAAAVVVVSGLVPAALPRLAEPLSIIIIAGAIIAFQRFILERERWGLNYDGLADLMIHIHSPSHPDSPLRWLFRSLISTFLLFCGIPVGPEGPAVEFTHAMAIRARASSARWFEQRRRTDAASALSGGIAAAFGAPFAGVIFPMEMGIGGRNLLSVASAFSAFLSMKYFVEKGDARVFDLSSVLYEHRFTGVWDAFLLLVIAVAAGLLSVFLIHFIKQTQRSLVLLSPNRTWVRSLCVAALLVLIAVIYRPGLGAPVLLMEQVFWLQRSVSGVWLTLFVQLLAFTLVMSGFGTLGCFWPSFAMGGLFGFGIAATFHAPAAEFSVLAGLVGGVSVWGGLFGTPIAAAVLGFELTRNVYVLIPCFLAGMIAREVRIRLRTPALLDSTLASRGMTLSEGRSVEILKSIPVRDVMVKDYEVVQEQEPLTELHQRMLDSRYQFLPVVNSQGQYTGLLTADMIQDAWQSQGSHTAQTGPLARLFEAKDVLYRVQFRAPTVSEESRLSATAGLFREIPCVAVVGEDMKVQGLLFAHSVRVAYEREVARRSLVGVQISDNDRL